MEELQRLEAAVYAAGMTAYAEEVELALNNNESLAENRAAVVDPPGTHH